MNINFDFDRQSEVFHPNAKGHGVIAEHVFQSVKQSNIRSSYETSANTCTIDCSSYRKDMSYNDETGTNHNVVKEKITDVRFIKNTELVLRDLIRFFVPQTTILLKLFSDEINLGSYKIDSEGNIVIPKETTDGLPPGMHVIMLTGESPSGEEIKVYQHIEIQGSDPADRDEDGIPDSEDRCMYVVTQNIDADKDEVDDGCDIEIDKTVEKIGNTTQSIELSPSTEPNIHRNQIKKHGSNVYSRINNEISGVISNRLYIIITGLMFAGVVIILIRNKNEIFK